MIPDDLHRRATNAARYQGISLGQLVREALTRYLLHTANAVPSALDLGEALEASQLGEVVQSTPELRRS